MAGFMEARTSRNEKKCEKAIETNDWMPNSPFAAEARMLLEAIKCVKTSKHDKE